MKKVLVTVLALAYLFILGSCGGESSTQSQGCQAIHGFFFKNGKWWKKVKVNKTPIPESTPIPHEEIEIEVEVNINQEGGC